MVHNMSFIKQILHLLYYFISLLGLYYIFIKVINAPIEAGLVLLIPTFILSFPAFVYGRYLSSNKAYLKRELDNLSKVNEKSIYAKAIFRLFISSIIAATSLIYAFLLIYSSVNILLGSLLAIIGIAASILNVVFAKPLIIGFRRIIGTDK